MRYVSIEALKRLARISAVVEHEKETEPASYDLAFAGIGKTGRSSVKMREIKQRLLSCGKLSRHRERGTVNRYICCVLPGGFGRKTDN